MMSREGFLKVRELNGTYEGTWKDDKKEGQGIFLFDNGDRYEGLFHLDLFHGESGYYALANRGGEYIGDFTSGRMEGVGVFLFANGDRYEGDFRSGLKSGKGVMFFANGDKYTGQWADDRMHGPGKYDFAKGVMSYDAQWIKGVCDDKTRHMSANPPSPVHVVEAHLNRLASKRKQEGEDKTKADIQLRQPAPAAAAAVAAGAGGAVAGRLYPVLERKEPPSPPANPPGAHVLAPGGAAVAHYEPLPHALPAAKPAHKLLDLSGTWKGTLETRKKEKERPDRHNIHPAAPGGADAGGVVKTKTRDVTITLSDTGLKTASAKLRPFRKDKLFSWGEDTVVEERSDGTVVVLFLAHEAAPVVTVACGSRLPVCTADAVCAALVARISQTYPSYASERAAKHWVKQAEEFPALVSKVNNARLLLSLCQQQWELTVRMQRHREDNNLVVQGQLDKAGRDFERAVGVLLLTQERCAMARQEVAEAYTAFKSVVDKHNKDSAAAVAADAAGTAAQEKRRFESHLQRIHNAAERLDGIHEFVCTIDPDLISGVNEPPTPHAVKSEMHVHANNNAKPAFEPGSPLLHHAGQGPVNMRQLMDNHVLRQQTLKELRDAARLQPPPENGRDRKSSRGSAGDGGVPSGGAAPAVLGEQGLANGVGERRSSKSAGAVRPTEGEFKLVHDIDGDLALAYELDREEKQLEALRAARPSVVAANAASSAALSSSSVATSSSSAGVARVQPASPANAPSGVAASSQPQPQSQPQQPAAASLSPAPTVKEEDDIFLQQQRLFDQYAAARQQPAQPSVARTPSGASVRPPSAERKRSSSTVSTSISGHTRSGSIGSAARTPSAASVSSSTVHSPSSVAPASALPSPSSLSSQTRRSSRSPSPVPVLQVQGERPVQQGQHTPPPSFNPDYTPGEPNVEGPMVHSPWHRAEEPAETFSNPALFPTVRPLRAPQASAPVLPMLSLEEFQKAAALYAPPSNGAIG